jgi:TonB-linked SusC/RagA family outer membrane protein
MEKNHKCSKAIIKGFWPCRAFLISSISLFLLLFGAIQVMGQDRVITGKVIDQDGAPILGASIQILGTAQGTISNNEGDYSITVDGPDAVLMFSFVGMEAQEITVGSNSVINVTMLVDTEELQEVVVVGYGTMQKENLTGAVASVDVPVALEAKPIADVAKSLQGVVSGVTITYENGNLNSEPNIKLRGYGSVNGASDPLVLIDGVEGRLSDVNPEAIAKISVLKDAASSSIYGVRAAFGVILVTTKEGQAGKTVVNYSNNFAWSKPIWDIKHAHMEELMEAIHVGAFRNNGGAPFAFGMGGTDWREKSIAWEEQYGYLGSEMDDETMIQGRDFEVIGGQFYSYRSWDVFDQILIDNAFSQTQNLAVSGGSDKIRYNLSYRYNFKEGLYEVNTETLDLHNLNLNVSADLTDWATLNLRTMYSKRIYEEPFNYRTGSLGYLFYALRWPSNFPYGLSDGTYFGAPEGVSFIGPIGFLREANRNRLERDYFRQTIEAIFDILDTGTQKIDFTANFSYAHSGDVDHEKGGSLPMINWWSQGNPPEFDPLYYSTTSSRNRTSYSTSSNELYSANAYANYTNTSLSGHTFKFLVGSNVEKNEYLNIYANRPFLLDPNLPELGLATGDPSVDNSKVNWSVVGFFGRFNYNFRNKILLEFNGRMDGSSRFPTGDRFAFFPSVSAGYKISEESFASFLDAARINNLKLRASWGQVGYQDVGQFAFISTMGSTNANWIVNSALETTFSNPSAVSPSLTWETIETLDFGVDLGLFNNKVELIFDWFQRTNKDMLGPGEQLPVVFGASVPQVNSGEMQTKGWELTLNVKHRFNEDLSVFFSGVLYDATAEITKWNNETGILTDFYTGKKLGEIWGFESNRLFQAGDFDSEGNLLDGIPVQDPNMYSTAFNLGPGDTKYEDLNGDGVVDKGAYTIGDHGDLKVIGNSTPRYEYGLRFGANYKWFDLNIFFQGIGKRDYWAQGNVALPAFHYSNIFAYQEDFWSEDNTDAFYPRPFTSNLANYLSNQRDVGQLVLSGYTRLRGINNYVPSSRYLQDMTYLRLKELTVGFTLPSEVTQRWRIQQLRIYFSGYNLWEHIGSYIPVDPESQTTSNTGFVSYGNDIPQSRSYSFGLQITF